MKTSEAVRLWVSSTGDPQYRYAPFPAPTTALPGYLALIPAKLFLPSYPSGLLTWVPLYPFHSKLPILTKLYCSQPFQLFWLSLTVNANEWLSWWSRSRGNQIGMGQHFYQWHRIHAHSPWYLKQQKTGMKKLQSPNAFWVLRLDKIY